MSTHRAAFWCVFSVLRPNTVADGPIRTLSASAGFFKRKKHSPHDKNPALALRALMNAPDTLNTYAFCERGEAHIAPPLIRSKTHPYPPPIHRTKC